MIELYLQYLMRTGLPKCKANMIAAKSPLVTLTIVNFWIPSLRLPRRFSSGIVLNGSRYHLCILWNGILPKIGKLFPDHLNV
jgi:hypothetical protein